MLFEELSLRRSINYKDPSRPMTAYSGGDKGFGQSAVITPKILKMDQEGCANILRKIEYEKAIEHMLSGTTNEENMAKSWFEENRLKTREKFYKVS
jgi:hypothetical protein